MAKKMFVSYILDETGSMMGAKEQTISGFNEYLDTLRDDESSQKVRFTLTKFNSAKIEIVHDGVKLSEVEHLNGLNYRPADLTPLYDAIGQTIRSLERKIEGKKRNALVVIQTDGHENHSREFTRDAIFKLIEEKRKEGWTFAFLGADQDAWAASRQMGIPQASSKRYASSRTDKMYRDLAVSTSDYLAKGGVQTDKFFKEEDEEGDKE